MTAAVTGLFGLPAAAYLGTFVAKQKEVAGLQNLDKKSRQRHVNRMIGVALLEVALELALSAREERAGRSGADRVEGIRPKGLLSWIYALRG